MCESAVGDAPVAGEPLGLTSMLLGAGARSIVLSSGLVPDDAVTVDAMTELHRMLAAGSRPADALAHVLAAAGDSPAAVVLRATLACHDAGRSQRETAPMVAVRVCLTVELTAHELDAIRALMDAAFDGDFGDDDWEHALGGTHALIGQTEIGAGTGAGIVAHASVVERSVTVAERPMRCGYVEAVAVAPTHQGRGLGTAVMRGLRPALDGFDLGVLSTGEWHFYERLGWERWQGTTWVRHTGGVLQRTADEDDGIMVLRTPRSPAVELTAAIVCEARSGDHW